MARLGVSVSKKSCCKGLLTFKGELIEVLKGELAYLTHNWNSTSGNRQHFKIVTILILILFFC